MKDICLKETGRRLCTDAQWAGTFLLIGISWAAAFLLIGTQWANSFQHAEAAFQVPSYLQTYHRQIPSCQRIEGTSHGTQAHGILMVVGFGILIPLGVLVARTLKPLDPFWFHLHRIIQATLPDPHPFTLSNPPTCLPAPLLICLLCRLFFLAAAVLFSAPSCSRPYYDGTIA